MHPKSSWTLCMRSRTLGASSSLARRATGTSRRRLLRIGSGATNARLPERMFTQLTRWKSCSLHTSSKCWTKWRCPALRVKQRSRSPWLTARSRCGAASCEIDHWIPDAFIGPRCRPKRLSQSTCCPCAARLLGTAFHRACSVARSRFETRWCPCILAQPLSPSPIH